MDFVNQRYFGKLGILTSIKEEASYSEDRLSLSPNTLQKSSSSNNINDEIQSAKLKLFEDNDGYIQLKKYTKDLEMLLKVINFFVIICKYFF